MCGNSGFFHGNITHPYFGKAHRNIVPGPPPIDPALQAQIDAEQRAAAAANARTAAVRQKRKRSSLLAGGNNVLGNPGTVGAPASAAQTSALAAGGAYSGVNPSGPDFSGLGV